MKRKKTNSPINGVSQRQRRRSLGDFNDTQKISADSFSRPKKLDNKAVDSGLVSEDAGVEVISEQDIIESTRSDVDRPNIGAGGWWARRKAKKLAKKQKWAKRNVALRTMRRTVQFAGIGMMLVGLYLGLNSWSALRNIIDRGGDGALALQDNIQPSELRSEGDGRVNILLIGIGGENHVAGDLADSIIIASVDPFAKEMAMLSVPRDLYVEIPGYYSTRINAAHSIGEEQQPEEGGGIALLQETIEEAFAINIHYYVRGDFQGL